MEEIEYIDGCKITYARGKKEYIKLMNSVITNIFKRKLAEGSVTIEQLQAMHMTDEELEKINAI